MKLAYLANIRFPSERAHSTQIAHMAQAFVKNGCEVELVTNTRAGAASSIDEEYNFEPAFKVRRIWSGYFNPKIRATFYVSECVFVISFLLSVGVRKYDILYARNEWVVYFLSFFVSSQKLVWESHEASFNVAARHILKKRIKTVVISKGICEKYQSLGINPDLILVADDGVDESFFTGLESKEEANRRLGLAQDKTYIGYIGGFDTWKGVETFFSAAALCENVQFVAIGGLQSEIETYQAKYPDVLFLGQIPYKDLRHVQQAFDILVIPNTGTNELSAQYTSPLKLFAHMTSGVPLVISDIPSLTTVVDSKHVTLFTPDSATALADGVKKVLAEYPQKNAAAKELAVLAQKYTWSNRAQLIIEFIS